MCLDTCDAQLTTRCEMNTRPAQQDTNAQEQEDTSSLGASHHGMLGVLVDVMAGYGVPWHRRASHATGCTYVFESKQDSLYVHMYWKCIICICQTKLCLYRDLTQLLEESDCPLAARIPWRQPGSQLS